MKATEIAVVETVRIADLADYADYADGIGDSAEAGDCGKNEVLIRVILSSVIIRDPDNGLIRDQKGDK